MDNLPAIDFARVADDLDLRPEQVASVVALLDQGNTVPFITRYRKERTGNLDEEQIRTIEHRVTALRQLADRAATILRLIDAQYLLTPELRREIEQADTLKRLDDLYLPFRPKRKSRAMLARSRGLEPLADQVWFQQPALDDLHAAALQLVDPAKDLTTLDDVLQGVADILAERIGDDADLRALMRQVAWQTGKLTVSSKKDAEAAGQSYRDYFHYSEAVSRIPPHRVMALNRGEEAGVLRVRFDWEHDRAQATVSGHLQLETHRFREFIERCAADALGRLIQPSLERELRRELSESAQTHALDVFARNLRNLLLQPPVRGQRVLAIDPGFRTGCKVVVLDETGNLVSNDLVYVTGSAEKRAAAIARLADVARRFDCSLIAIGNGTACRETEELVSQMIAEHLPHARYLIVNEAGASIYSTSTVAREEFPELDATVRGTVSIGRRLLDPLSELVKIDPQHIGVGQYQHDVNPKLLRGSLDEVIESCVNYVGVELNTASASLLRSVSGFNQLIARRVVEWRDRHGRFNNRRQLLEIAGIGEATFTQAAGFLKITGGDEPLDSTWIHPESYPAAAKVLARLNLSPELLGNGNHAPLRLRDNLATLDKPSLAAQLNVGLPTLQDILDALARPGRDPRIDLPGPVFRAGILKLDDLERGMELTGTVLNVVDFGAFVDVGLKDSGLVHISQLSPHFVRTPHDIVSVGDIVTVWVLEIDAERRRVSLTMIPPGAEVHHAPRRLPRDKTEATAAPPPPPTSPPPSISQSTPKEIHAGQHKKHAPPQLPKQSKNNAPPPPPLTDDVLEGRQPMRGFDELKQLWRSRDK